MSDEARPYTPERLRQIKLSGEQRRLKEEFYAQRKELRQMVDKLDYRNEISILERQLAVMEQLKLNLQILKREIDASHS